MNGYLIKITENGERKPKKRVQSKAATDVEKADVIVAVKPFEYLYNPTLPDYKNKLLCDDTWALIDVRLGKEDKPGFARRVFANLKTEFSSRRKIMKRRSRIPTVEQKKVLAWPHWESLQFLDQHMPQREAKRERSLSNFGTLKTNTSNQSTFLQIPNHMISYQEDMQSSSTPVIQPDAGAKEIEISNTFTVSPQQAGLSTSSDMVKTLPTDTIFVNDESQYVVSSNGNSNSAWSSAHPSANRSHTVIEGTTWAAQSLPQDTLSSPSVSELDAASVRMDDDISYNQQKKGNNQFDTLCNNLLQTVAECAKTLAASVEATKPPLNNSFQCIAGIASSLPEDIRMETEIQMLEILINAKKKVAARFLKQ